MKTKKTTKMIRLLLAAMMLLLTVFGASAHAIRLFGYQVGLDGIRKENQVQNQAQEQVQEQTQTQQKTGSQHGQSDEMVDIQEALKLANSDKYTQAAMKEFAGDHYCIMTDKRVAYFSVSDDGSLEWISDEPSDCYVIRSTEAYAKELWEKVRNRERVSYGEIKQNVDIPWKLRMRLAYTGLKTGIKESFA